MSTFKDVLFLLAIFVLYGIAGRLDYEDAVGLEQIRQEWLQATCLTDMPAGHDTLAQITDQGLDLPNNDTDADRLGDRQPCLTSVF